MVLCDRDTFFLVKEEVPRIACAPRIDALTGLRILPALGVLLSHLKAPPWAGPHVKAFLDSGYAGVTIFFVLSGFVLTHNYFDRLAQPSAKRVWSYLVARLARVYPLYLLMLVWLSFSALWRGTVDKPLWWTHALALQAWTGTLGEAYAFNAPGWSISVEFFLYACFPLFVWVLGPALRRPRNVAAVLLVVVCGMAVTTGYFYVKGYAALPPDDPSSSHRWLFRNPLCRMGDFLLGMGTARFLALRAPIPERLLRWGGLLGVVLIVAIMCWPAHVYSAVSWDVSYALPATALIFCLAATPSSLGSRWLATKPLLLLGEASYALYLCHVHALDRLSLGRLPADAWLAMHALTITLVVAFAVGLHVAIERPARELLRAWLDPFAPPRATSTVAQPRALGEPPPRRGLAE